MTQQNLISRRLFQTIPVLRAPQTFDGIVCAE
jgi:hypothetical protein